MAILERKISRNGQLAIPRSLLRELNLVPPAYVEIESRNGTLVIAPRKLRRLSDEDFRALLEELWKRSPRLSQRQITQIVERARRP